MERVKKLLVFLFERLLEIFLITGVIMFLERPAKGVGGGGVLEEYLRTLNLPAIYYIVSGYILSCVYFGLVERNSNIKMYVSTMLVAFSIHTSLLAVLTHTSIGGYVLVFGAYGIVIVFFSSFTGACLMQRISKR